MLSQRLRRRPSFRCAHISGVAADRRTVLISSVIVVALLFVLTGCSSAPSRNILGSYFPSWMICALVGMCATVAVRGLLVRLGIDEELPMPIVVYLAFAIAFSLAAWLLWLA